MKSWNFMKFIDILDSATLHETFVFLAQNQGLSGLDPQKPKNTTKTIIFLEFTKTSPFPAEFLQILQKHAKPVFEGFWWFPGRHMLETLLFL